MRFSRLTTDEQGSVNHFKSLLFQAEATQKRLDEIAQEVEKADRHKANMLEDAKGHKTAQTRQKAEIATLRASLIASGLGEFVQEIESGKASK